MNKLYSLEVTDLRFTESLLGTTLLYKAWKQQRFVETTRCNLKFKMCTFQQAVVTL